MSRFVSIVLAVLLAGSGAIVGQYMGGLLWAFVGGVIGLLAGLIISSHRPVDRWMRAVVATVRLLVKQERDPKSFIRPFVSHVDLYPDPKKDVTSANYISVALGWDNRTFMAISISNMTGSLRVEGSDPPCVLPSPDPSVVNVKPLGFGTTGVNVRLDGDALKMVTKVRDDGHGALRVCLKVSASIRLQVDHDHRELDFGWIDSRAYYDR